MSNPAISSQVPATETRMVVTGRLEHLGDGVRCPEIITDDGRREPVFGLAADIPLGTRLRLTGQTGLAVRCKGKVLIIETLEILTD